MAGSRTVIAVDRSWARGFRSAICDALFTRDRAYWLVRLAFAFLMGVAGQASFGHVCGYDGTPGAVWLFLPVAWLVYPVVRLRAAKALRVTILDEGLSLDADAQSLSVAWGAVRSVRRTLWDLVIVLDGSTICIPLRALPPGMVDGVIARLRGPSDEGRSSSDASPVGAPYRIPETRPPGPEDEEASPREWVAPAAYRESVLAFPSAMDHVRALFMLKRGAFGMPSVLLVLAGLLALLGTAGGADRHGEVVRFTNVGAIMAIVAVASIIADFLPSLLALRDRAVRERSAGVLYAIGASGLYARTHSFERRESWDRVRVVRVGPRRVALFTASLVHVIPQAAFASEGARERFVTMLRGLAASPRSS